MSLFVEFKPKRRNPFLELEKIKASLKAQCDYYIRLRGVPWGSEKQRIVNFFTEIEIEFENVLLPKLANGKDSGEAIVGLKSPEDYERAFSFNRNTMGRRYIEIFASTPYEWEVAAKRKRNYDSSMKFDADSILNRIHEHSFVAILRGLPFSTHPDDISKGFLADFPVLGVFLTVNARNQASGICYVEFETEELRDCAVREKHNAFMTNRYVEVYRSDHHSLINAVRFGQERNGKFNTPIGQLRELSLEGYRSENAGSQSDILECSTLAIFVDKLCMPNLKHLCVKADIAIKEIALSNNSNRLIVTFASIPDKDRFSLLHSKLGGVHEKVDERLLDFILSQKKRMLLTPSGGEPGDVFKNPLGTLRPALRQLNL